MNTLRPSRVCSKTSWLWVVLARPMEPSIAATTNAATESGSTESRTLPCAWPCLRAAARPRRQEFSSFSIRDAESFVDRRHLLSQIVQWAAPVDCVLGLLLGPGLDGAEDAVQGIVRFGHRLDPPVHDHRADDLLQHRIAELELVPEMVVEGALGDTRVLEDPIEARRLKAVTVDLVEGRLEERLTGQVGVSLAGGCGVHGVCWDALRQLRTD